jgi:uncharacterized membrane protein YfcA
VDSPVEEMFVLFLVVGFLAQLVDGALGMAYGVVSSSVLLAFGVPPAAASASVHAAELFTTAASAGSHVWHRNVNWNLFARLARVGFWAPMSSHQSMGPCLNPGSPGILA